MESAALADCSCNEVSFSAVLGASPEGLGFFVPLWFALLRLRFFLLPARSCEGASSQLRWLTVLTAKVCALFFFPLRRPVGAASHPSGRRPLHYKAHTHTHTPGASTGYGASTKLQ